MASVRIDSGPVTAELPLHYVPKEKWRDLLEARRSFAAIKITYDCRCLVRFVRDADEMWQALGYKSADDLIRNGYDLEPDEVRLAVEWLQLNAPDEPVSLDFVQQQVKPKASERSRDAAKATTGEVLPREVGLNQHTKQTRPDSHSQIANGSQAARAEMNGVSKRQQEKLDALARRAPELLEEVRAGSLSCHAACVQAGIVKKPSPLDLLRAAWKKASAEERAAFLAEIT